MERWQATHRHGGVAVCGVSRPGVASPPTAPQNPRHYRGRRLRDHSSQCCRSHDV